MSLLDPPQVHAVGLVYNARIGASELTETIARWLEARGVSAWRCPVADRLTLPGPADLIVTLGGDGTILRVARAAAPAGIPILGINLGRVGFLTESLPKAWQETLTRVLACEGVIEERMMLSVALWREDTLLAREHALNDAVISRGALARTVRLHTSVDGTPLARYVADGLILATPTGSTAYAYAAGGPILPPWLENIVLVPTAPHLSLERPLVLAASAVVEVRIETQLPGMLSVDGRMEGELLDGDLVRVARSEMCARFWRLRHPHDFYATLVQRLTPRNGDGKRSG